MIRLKSKAIGWKAIMSMLKEMVEEAGFLIDKEKITFFASDPSHVIKGNFTWNKENFEEFVFDANIEKLGVGFRVDDFNKAIKRFKDDDDILLEYPGKESFTISSGKKSFDLNIINPEVLELEKPKYPTLEPELLFDISLKEFKEKIYDALVFGDFLRIRIEDDKLIMSSSGDSGKTESVHAGNFDLKKGPIDSMFSLDYIKTIISDLAKLTDDLSCIIVNDKLLWMKITIKDIGLIDYFIAAKVSSRI